MGFPVVRHLNSLNLTAEPPSFLQPSYYGGYPQASLPPPYTEYAQEIAYMGSRHVPPNDSGYWNQTRDQAACLLGNQAGWYVCGVIIELELRSIVAHIPTKTPRAGCLHQCSTRLFTLPHSPIRSFNRPCLHTHIRHHPLPASSTPAPPLLSRMPLARHPHHNQERSIDQRNLRHFSTASSNRNRVK